MGQGRTAFLQDIVSIDWVYRYLTSQREHLFFSTAIRVIPQPVVRPLRRPATVSVHVVRVATRQSCGDTLKAHEIRSWCG